jgi:hypothetical protein
MLQGCGVTRLAMRLRVTRRIFHTKDIDNGNDNDNVDDYWLFFFSFFLPIYDISTQGGLCCLVQHPLKQDRYRPGYSISESLLTLIFLSIPGQTRCRKENNCLAEIEERQTN